MLKRKIVIDTDPGIDDTIALTVAINSGLNIELVTTVFGNVNLEQTTINALRILEFLGKDIPVAKGVPRALFFDPGIDGSHVHGVDGLGGYPMPYPKTKVVDQVAVEAIKDLIEKSEENITLVALGALTNIALFIKIYPHLLDKIEEIVVMGGSLGAGNVNSAAEFNTFKDPHAAKIVFDSSVKVTVFGLDVTRFCLVSSQKLEENKNKSKVSSMAREILKGYIEENNELMMHDSAPIAYLVHPEIFDIEDKYIDVSTDERAPGALVSGFWTKEKDKKPNVRFAVNVDSKKFEEWLLANLV
jgi:inosine-uridine preferring nucleoside hydrolase-domain protein